MLPRSMSRFFVGLLCLAVLGFSVPPAGAEDIQSLLDDEKKSLEKLKKRIARRDRDLSAISKKETRILKKLEHLDDRLKVKERELKIYQWNLKINRKQLADLSPKLEEMASQLARKKKLLGKRLRSIYKEGDMFLVKVLFSSDNINDLLQRVKYMEKIMAYDIAMFGNYVNALGKLESHKRVLLQGQNDLIKFKQASLKKRQELSEQKGAKSRFLKKVLSQKIYALQTRRELLKASGNLNELILKLEEKLVLGEGLSIADVKGRLVYPVKGKIINRFGRKMDKRFDTYIVYNGINLKVEKGTDVRSIFHGKVLYTGTLEGYGKIIIIGHGDDYHSLYGHLDNIRAEMGDWVKEGTVIGESGDTGSLLGATLYLEIRHKGKPVEPTRWFQVARK
ncbi:MAG: hypothetical protein E2O41_04875 [Nitrospina sp.]|nr:MAG: hypothetical protein E2O41_04875 [Nitrospina sp.]